MREKMLEIFKKTYVKAAKKVKAGGKAPKASFARLMKLGGTQGNLLTAWRPSMSQRRRGHMEFHACNSNTHDFKKAHEITDNSYFMHEVRALNKGQHMK
jgi:hypothetical protein